MKRITAAVVIVVAAVTCAVAYAAQSPKTVLASMLAAARAKHSVHWEARDVSGSLLVSTGADVAADRGSQYVDFTIGKKHAHVHIRIVSKTGYVRADALGLEVTLGLSKAKATKYAEKWISIPKGDKLYGSTAGDVTLPSLLGSLTPHGKLVTVKEKTHGVRVIGVLGATGKGARRQVKTLVARAQGKRLPVAASFIAPGKSEVSAIVLSKWDEKVTVTAPASSTPIATVRGN